MTHTLRITNVEDAVMDELSRRATKHGRSLEDEHRAILLRGLEMEPSSFDDLAAKLREVLAGRNHTPSQKLMKESREER